MQKIAISNFIFKEVKNKRLNSLSFWLKMIADFMILITIKVIKIYQISLNLYGYKAFIFLNFNIKNILNLIRLKMNFGIMFLIFIFYSQIAQAKINIFACEPEWASLAKEITGDLANISVATTHNQDPHYIQVKPSLIAKIREADLVFCSGASLEEGWLPLLIQKAYKKSVKLGEVGHFMASDYVSKIEINNNYSLTRADGHIHPHGNPHIHLDPRNITKIANELTARLKVIDKENAHIFAKNQEIFNQKWQKSFDGWQKRAENIRNMTIIINHNAWSYLINWLDLKLLAKIEEKPGINPSARHLGNLLRMTKDSNVDLILYASFENDRSIKWLSSKSKVKAIKLPFTIDQSQINSLFDLFDSILTLLESNRNSA